MEVRVKIGGRVIVFTLTEGVLKCLTFGAKNAISTLINTDEMSRAEVADFGRLTSFLSGLDRIDEGWKIPPEKEGEAFKLISKFKTG